MTSQRVQRKTDGILSAESLSSSSSAPATTASLALLSDAHGETSPVTMQEILWKRVITRAHPILDVPVSWLEGDLCEQASLFLTFAQAESLPPIDCFFQIIVVDREQFQGSFVEFVANHIRESQPVIHWVDRADSFSFRMVQEQCSQIAKRLQEFELFQTNFSEAFLVQDLAIHALAPNHSISQVSLPGVRDAVSSVLVSHYNDSEKRVYCETQHRFYYFSADLYESE